ncbi:MAG: CofH family radical SAM protein, partial [Thermoanaerobaculia bacterium]
QGAHSIIGTACPSPWTQRSVRGGTEAADYRPSSDHPEAYVLSFEEIAEKIQEMIDLGGTGVLLQGGVNGDLPFSFYEEMFRFIRKTFPTVHLHALSAPEIYFLQKITKWSMREVIARLRDAGLQSIPGGGAEILEDSVRKRVWALTKAPTDKWIDVHETAHGLGLRTTATMMFGVGETYAQRVEHFRVIRELQDRTGGFTAWIPWTFQEENTALDGKVEVAGGFEYLKTLAVSRLYLDNIRHVQGSWVTQGAKIGQVSLSFGADDLGSIMIEENVVYAAGARNRMTQEGMRRLISDAGYEPVQRRTLYDACRDFCCTSPIPNPKERGALLPIAGADIDSSVASA